MGSVDSCGKMRPEEEQEYQRTGKRDLFSKKNRYEVRKLNTEKRPWMKGRFVKQTTFAGSAFSYQMNKVSWKTHYTSKFLAYEFGYVYVCLYLMM